MINIPIKNLIGINNEYILKHHPIFYNDIFKTITIENISLAERIWLYKNELQTIYTYFHKDFGLRLNRFNFRKDILVKQGFDKNKTEHQIMKERKYYRIYDCGNLKFIKINKKPVN
jgi:hypothetical protein